MNDDKIKSLLKAHTPKTPERSPHEWSRLLRSIEKEQNQTGGAWFQLRWLANFAMVLVVMIVSRPVTREFMTSKPMATLSVADEQALEVLNETDTETNEEVAEASAMDLDDAEYDYLALVD